MKFLSIAVKCLGVVKAEDYVARNLEVSMKGVSHIRY